MMNQCNLCGLRDDSVDLISKNKTWCLVYDKEVDNKHQGCVHWKPDSSSIRSQNAFIAESIKKRLQGQNNTTEKKKRSDLKTMSSSVSSIWKEIEEVHSVSKRLFGRRINFISDSYKRKTIFRDVAHAYELEKNGFSKPAVLLAGGVIEEILRLFLKYKKIKVSKNEFASYIDACKKNGLLRIRIHGLTDFVRHFRNNVHLEKEKSSKDAISTSAAKGAVSSIFTIVNDL
jgi:hypothetical protein